MNYNNILTHYLYYINNNNNKLAARFPVADTLSVIYVPLTTTEPNHGVSFNYSERALFTVSG